MEPLPLYELALDGPDLTIELCGHWSIHGPSFEVDAVDKAILTQSTLRKVIFIFAHESCELQWDSTLPAFLHHVVAMAETRSLAITYENFPKTLLRLLELAKQGEPRPHTPILTRLHSFTYRLGQTGLAQFAKVEQRLIFFGEVMMALGKSIGGKRLFRAKDFWLVVQQCGAEALPIITLISFLIGLTMAFVGAIQLMAFGASIYVANLVGIAMVREMGAFMTGIIMCGRTGAAFASMLGSMKVSEEIDALKTFGLDPMGFLVLPRFLALFFMVPLLCVYADFIGILGGLAVGMGMLDLSLAQYITQTKNAITLTSFSTGIVKSTVFGGLVALAGCYKGMHCGQNAAAVGHAVTSAVVSGITSIVVADALFAILFHLLDI
jgi:phospholipid/cholesterol/gamma-HCH transport system permease protein